MAFNKCRSRDNIRRASVISLVKLLGTSLQLLLVSLWWHVWNVMKYQPLYLHSYCYVGRHTAHVHGDRRTFGLMVLSGCFAGSVLVLMMLYKYPSQPFVLEGR